MSCIKNDLTENNISQRQTKLQNNNNNSISYIFDKSEQIKVQDKKYKYSYTNNNNTKNQGKASKTKQNNNIKNINIKYEKSKNISISPNRRSFQSPSKLNCETNYSINKITNTYYVNGLNKNIAKININRSPDLRFIPYQNKNIYEKKNFNFNNQSKKCSINNSIITNLRSKNEYSINNEYKQYFSNEELKNQKNNIKINSKLEEKTLIANNHNFKSVNNCSKEKNRINSKLSSNNKKYKCEIKIHNVNDQQKRNIRTFSYDNSFNKRNTTMTKVFISDHSKAYDDLEFEFNRHKSFDNKYLKMQNSQNMQILQEERLYQILVPIPPNEIDYICDFQFNPIEKGNIISKTEIISENEKNERKNKNIDYINKNIKYVKKTKWGKINSPKRTKNKELNIENFSINYEESLRKFKGKMLIENTDLSYERTPRNWNGVLQPKSNRPLSIEREKNKNKILSETSVDKLTYNGKIPIPTLKINWNQINNKENIENINLLKEKPNKILSKQKEEIFSIKGQGKKWNDKLLTKDENNFSIQSDRDKKNREEIEENEEKNIINDDEIGKIMSRMININIIREIQNGVESSETSSEYDILKKIGPCTGSKFENFIKNSFESNGNDRKVIVNNISKKYPKKIEITNEKYQNKNICSMKKEVNNNLKLEFPEPEIVMNPHYLRDKTNDNIEYNYRESITNKKIFVRENCHKQLNKEENLGNDDDIEGLTSETKGLSEINSYNLEESQSNSQTFEFPTPTSNMRCEYREEIISLSPIYKERNRQILEDINNNNKNHKIEKNEDINYMEEEYKNYSSNIENSEIQSSKLEEEKEISPMERGTNESNSVNNNKNYSDILYNGQKPKTQYIIKNKSNKNNKNKSKTFIMKKEVRETIQNNENFGYDNKKHKINANNSIKNGDDYVINYPSEDKNNFFNIKEKMNKPIEENFIKYKNNENIKDINENNFQKSNGLYKSQLNNNENNKKEQFGTNSQISYGNIIINNTLKRKKKNIINNENKDDENNLIHHYENMKNDINIKNENNNNFQIQNNNLNRKIKILKK